VEGKSTGVGAPIADTKLVAPAAGPGFRSRLGEPPRCGRCGGPLFIDEIELVRYVTPETSAEQLELLTAHAEKMLQLLELPYRVVRIASGDTGFASAHTYDLEVYAPGVGRWLEVSSCSNFTDFQARRANIRYKPADGGKPRFVHTLNGSGLAFPRIIASILEHHQQEDGSVRVPAALSKYLGAERLT
jgi:seryl-tRNA synthetase